MPCSFQVGPRWTKPKVDSTGRLIWSFILCAEVEAIDHCLHSPAILEGSSKGWVYSALIYLCLSFQKGAQYMQAYVTSNITTWKRLLFPAHCSGGEMKRFWSYASLETLLIFRFPVYSENNRIDKIFVMRWYCPFLPRAALFQSWAYWEHW